VLKLYNLDISKKKRGIAVSVKEKVLAALEAKKGEDISGEALAREIGVSRMAVWKAVKSLKDQGYPIESSTNRGYKLNESSDILSAEGVRVYLNKTAQAAELFVFDEIDSTNLEAKRRAIGRGNDAAIIIANSQTLGRGRFGRTFHSPEGCGIYMSILLKPTKEQMAEAVMLTTAAAVAVCRAVNSLSDVSPQIKWVNDIYVNDKKVCGILTEAVADMESGMIESVVIGIGINFKTGEQPLPDEIANIAGAIFDKKVPISRNRMAAQVVNELFDILPDLQTRSFLKEYRERSMLLGKEIVYSRGDQKFSAIAEDIDDDGALVVTFIDGTREALRSGEVSVRPKSMEAALPFPAGNE